jgi:hypothetical protein
MTATPHDPEDDTDTDDEGPDLSVWIAEQRRQFAEEERARQQQQETTDEPS